LIAISFQVSFYVGGETDPRYQVDLELKGVCSYDPNRMEVSDIEMRERVEHYSRPGGGMSRVVLSDPQAHRQYLPEHVRVIS
jgi:hypothetical protein